MFFLDHVFLLKKIGSEKKLLTIEPSPYKQQDAQLGRKNISQ